ncbi:hypothetical protein [Nostoc sp.]|uniref:hypothetical protein n=1 Tax=Nostoc sp. TaxID=1180 RepID=UPI002FF81604
MNCSYINKAQPQIELVLIMVIQKLGNIQILNYAAIAPVYTTLVRKFQLCII